MSPAFKLAAQNAVNALQGWYGASPTGLYTWTARDDVIMQAANITNSGIDIDYLNIHSHVSDAIKLFGLWDALRDTLRWWNTANAITALVDYMLVTGDRSYIESVVDNTFKNGPNTWRPKSGLNAGDWIAAATAAFVQANANSLNPPAPGGGHLFPGWADPGAVFIEHIAVYYTNFLNDFHDDEGWWVGARVD
jgi:hypothetical protein